MDYGFIGPGDLWMSMGLHTRDSMLKFGQADELKWCYDFIVTTLRRHGKVAGGFTRGGDPSTLLRAGFSMVALGNDTFDLMNGAASIMTGGLILQPKPTEPGLERLKGWTRAFSRLNPTPKFLLSEMVPTLARHMWTVKGPSAPKDALLKLPAVMPPDVSKVADMEKDPMLEAVAK